MFLDSQNPLSAMPTDPVRLTPRLCRAARALLGWRQADVAQAAGVPEPTINAFEAKPEIGKMMAANARLIVQAFEAAGLEFIPENGGGDGIRFRERRTPLEPAPGQRPPKRLYDSEFERAMAEGDDETRRRLIEGRDRSPALTPSERQARGRGKVDE